MDDVIKNYDPIAYMTADQAVEETLIDLAINILRVARGAGKPERVCHQVLDCARSIKRYAEERNMLPGYQQIHNALHITPDGPTPGPSDGRRVGTGDHEVAHIVKGGLRVAAARLNRDHIEEDRGREDLQRAVAKWNAVVTGEA